MKPLEISLQARKLSTECIMYLRWSVLILFFLQKSMEFSRMLLLLKIYFSLFWMIYLLVMNILYQKSAEFQIRLFLWSNADKIISFFIIRIFLNKKFYMIISEFFICNVGNSFLEWIFYIVIFNDSCNRVIFLRIQGASKKIHQRFYFWRSRFLEIGIKFFKKSR